MSTHDAKSWQGNTLAIATGGLHQVPDTWMSATAIHPLFYDDPGQIWLRYHGASHGLAPSSSAFHFIDFIGEKGRELESAWVEKIVGAAPRVCQDAREVHSVEKVEETWNLLRRGTPAVVQPALWWAPERLYGVPDLIVHSSWVQSHLPDLLPPTMPAHYLVIDFKFTSRLEGKKPDSVAYSAQIRSYSYMLGHLQGIMPAIGLLIPRDRLFDPIAVGIRSKLGEPLDDDIAVLRDQFLAIKLDGHQLTPWSDEAVASNPKHDDDYWNAAKRSIAWERVDGVDPCVLPWIWPKQRRQLAEMGFRSVRDLLAVPAEAIPLERCDNLGPARCRSLRAILTANRRQAPVAPPRDLVPGKVPHEWFVDLEYFSNANADFDRQWPTLEGCEMIFMAGVGWLDGDTWHFQSFAAEAETLTAEGRLLDQFVDFLQDHCQGSLGDPNQTRLYHWSAAEAWQSQRAAARQGVATDHPLWRLPWFDLERRVALQAPIGLPGAWDYRLKSVARALGKLDAALASHWPEDLDEGKSAMVMGWRAYQSAAPRQTPEMALLTRYLEADCRALMSLLRWLRTAAGNQP